MMVSPSDRGSSDSEDMSGLTPDRASSAGSQLKTCADCGTTKTPLWRGGPAGPKSLCNACGIRSRKKRRAMLGLSKEEKRSKKSSDRNSNQSGGKRINNTIGDGGKLENTVRRKLFEIGREVTMQRRRSTMEMEKQRKKLGEEEQAAFLLMAMSCGSVYA